MSFPRYERYKDSGVEWLGEVPEHWEIWRLSHAFGVIGSGTTPPSNESQWYEGGEVPWVTTSELREVLITETSKSVTSDALTKFSALRVYPVGSLVIAMYGATIGRLGILGVAATTNQACCVLCHPNNLEIRFCFYWFQGFKDNLIAWYANGGGQPNINQQILAELRVPAPSRDEQTAIATFIDREIAKIDALIAEQQRLIELLKEKRQAVISHAITKGLNPDARMKDSGIEWLGEVPEHWDVVPLMRLTEPGRAIMYGIVLPGPDMDEGIPIVKGGDVRPHRLRLDLLCRTTPEIEAPFARARLRPNDIVYSIRGSIGDAEIVPEELRDANITQDVARISPNERAESQWLLFTMKCVRVFVQLEQKSLGAAVRGINIFDLKRARIPVPPQEEQSRIASFLDRETAKLDALTAEAQTAITLLQERRTALISAAVTGKIDVRGFFQTTQV